MILPQGLSTIFGVFSLLGLAFPAGSTVLQNDLAPVMVRRNRKTQNAASDRTGSSPVIGTISSIHNGLALWMLFFLFPAGRLRSFFIMYLYGYLYGNASGDKYQS